MKIDHERSFGRHILTCLATALGICAAVEVACLSLGIAPFFTPNLPFNEKMRFLREHRPGPRPVAVVSGASIALNDIDSDQLQDNEGRPFINLGANGVSVPTSEQFYRRFASLYPVREIIFAASPVEMRDAYRSDADVSAPVFRRYVLGKMSMAEEFTYRDISGLMSYWKNWSAYHSRASLSSMEFTKTGAVPLEVEVRNAGPRAQVGEVLDLNPHCTRCMSDLSQYCSDVRKEGLPFTIVLGPVLPAVIEEEPRVRAIIADRKEQFRAVAAQCGAQVFDVTDYATLDDSCFANSLHLNAQGMRVMTTELRQFRRGEAIPKGIKVTCSGLDLASASGSNQQQALSARTKPN